MRLIKKETNLVSSNTNARENDNTAPDLKPNFRASLPFLLMHIGALGVLFVNFSWFALSLCLALYILRATFITGFYHRYFSHKTYKTSRVFQFIIAFLGASAAQNGPLWWASHHRRHHRYSDQEGDVHSPIVNSVYWSHFGWLLCKRYKTVEWDLIQDFAKFPELRLLDRFHYVAPVSLLGLLYFAGEVLGNQYPSLQTSGLQLVFWGGFMSTVILYHVTFMVNSVSHLWGSRRFETKDQSRNNWLVGILAVGEGWHNNHHRYPQSERQGFYWWEIDITHYALTAASYLGLVWNIVKPPQHIYDEAEQRQLEKKAA